MALMRHMILKNLLLSICHQAFVALPNGKAQLPAPIELSSTNYTIIPNDCKKAAIQRSAEGAGQLQRVLGRIHSYSPL
jgi:hypothetical protein